MSKAVSLVRRVVSNKEFADALADSNNTKIMHAVTSRYHGLLSNEQLHECSLHALWRCLQYHDFSYKQKFTSSLYRFTLWEVRRELAKVRNDKSFESFNEDSHDVGSEIDNPDNPRRLALEHIKQRMRFLKFKWQRVVIKQYYFKNMTMSEIGAANGYTKEAARQRVHKAIDSLKKLCKFDNGRDTRASVLCSGLKTRTNRKVREHGTRH